MAKNQARKNDPAKQANKAKAAESKAKEQAKKPKIKEEDVLYQVKTKRDEGLIKAFITFTYRVMHPRVSARLVLAAEL